MKWHILSTIHCGGLATEILAAACDEGIGIIARWVRRPKGGWDVFATDTEQADMTLIRDFEEECVPPTPPDLDDE